MMWAESARAKNLSRASSNKRDSHLKEFWKLILLINVTSARVLWTWRFKELKKEEQEEKVRVKSSKKLKILKIWKRKQQLRAAIVIVLSFISLFIELKWNCKTYEWLLTYAESYRILDITIVTFLLKFTVEFKHSWHSQTFKALLSIEKSIKQVNLKLFKPFTMLTFF